MKKTIAGKCLLSSPFLSDEPFYKTVVFILQHSEHQAYGVILNRPTDHSLTSVVSMVCEMKCVHEGPLQFGGPVDAIMLAIHDHSEIGGYPCGESLYATSDQDDLRKLFLEPEANIKVFDGCAGWSAGQLEMELESGSWFVSDITPEEVMSNDDLWEVMVKRIGNRILEVGLELTGSVGNATTVDASRN